jgi:hypothetical protein
MEGLGLRFIDGRSAVGAVDWHDEVAVQGPGVERTIATGLPSIAQPRTGPAPVVHT